MPREASVTSVTQWIGRLKAGDPDAAQKLWERYFRRLVGLARKKLRAAPRRAADEEDVALSAFDSFCRGAEKDRFPRLQDRWDLWQLLVLLTARKAFDLAQHERRQKRGGGAVLDEAALPCPTSSSGHKTALEQIECPEPTPAFAAQVAEECRRLLERLDSPELRSVAMLKVEGYGNEEIAAQLGCGLRTVERRLRLIRNIWEQEEPAKK
jgi:DNA-directed RNA polymerase specialized sigma24 family protein